MKIGPFQRIALGNRTEEEALEVWGRPQFVGEDRWPLSRAFEDIVGANPYPIRSSRSGLVGYFNSLRLFTQLSRLIGPEARAEKDIHEEYERFLKQIWKGSAGDESGMVRLFKSSTEFVADGMVLSGLMLGRVEMKPSFMSAKLCRMRFAGAKLIGTRFNDATLEDINFKGADLTDVDFTGATFKGRIRFSKGTKITLEQLGKAKDAAVAIAEYHRVFDSTGDGDSGSGRLRGFRGAFVRDSGDRTASRMQQTSLPTFANIPGSIFPGVGLAHSIWQRAIAPFGLQPIPSIFIRPIAAAI